MNWKGKTLLIVAVIIAQLAFAAAVQYDDDVSAKKLRLQDIENEQNQREEHEQQQPPGKFHMKTGFPPIAQAVRPLEQTVSIARPLSFKGVRTEYVSSAASDFNFGISPLAHNGIDGNVHEGDIDTDIVTYSHDEPPLPFNRRPQLELLSAGGAGYALSSADVLVPPFREDETEHIPSERRPLSQLPPRGYERPFRLGNNRAPTSYVGNAVNDAAANYLRQTELPAAPAGTIEYATGYLPINQHSSRRPVIQYGSPHADFRRPNIYTQSNQLAYAPVRTESDGSTSAVNVPYPPSFISITTRRPGTGFNVNSAPQPVRPLGRSLAYGKQFRPSAVDPVPDIFANRQAKSLLDSYIPSWVVARMLEEQRANAYAEPFVGNVPYNRYLKRADTVQARMDDYGTDISSERDVAERKIVKKSLPVEKDVETEEMVMTP